MHNDCEDFVNEIITVQNLFSMVYNIISHSLFFLSSRYFSFLKKQKSYVYIYRYQFLPKKFMFAKYTKSHAYICHVYNCIS